MKIEKGKRYLCIKNYSHMLNSEFIYNKNSIYKSEEDHKLIDEHGRPYSFCMYPFLSEYFQLVADDSNDTLNTKREKLGYAPIVIEPETRPSHYGGDVNPHEPIKIIQHYNLSFELGNVIKYVLRSDKKGTRIEDLNKAMQYLQFELDKIKE